MDLSALIGFDCGECFDMPAVLSTQGPMSVNVQLELIVRDNIWPMQVFLVYVNKNIFSVFVYMCDCLYSSMCI